jgi:ElaA protein
VRFSAGVWPGQGIRISAQARLERFYAELGFARQGPDYGEDSIPHVEMLRGPHEL